MEELPEWVLALPEDQQMEIQVLQSIFLDSFTFQHEKKSFQIVVVPSFGGAFQNLCSIRFTTSFPEQYPNVPLEHIELECIEGTIPSEWLMVLRSQLLEKSSEIIGEQMVYTLIEQLKDYLQNYNEDIKYGYFGLLSDEVIYRVLEYLRPEDISRLTLVNKTLNRLANDSSLWEQICQDRLDEDEYKNLLKNSGSSIWSKTKLSEDSKQKLYWRRSYYHTRSWVMKDIPYSYIAAIFDRKGTGDLWMQHFGSWEESLIFHVNKKHGVVLEVDGRLRIGYEQAGSYKFMSSQEILQKYGDLPWAKSIESCKLCPYLGDLIGFICWTVDQPKYAYYLMTVFIETSRGVVARVSDTSHFMQCVSLYKYPLPVVADPGQYGFNLFLMIDTKDLAQKPKYLQDIVQDVNMKLKRKHDKVKNKNVTNQELPKENENRPSEKTKITKNKKTKAPSKPCVFDFVPVMIGDWYLSPNLIGTEHIDFASAFRKIQIGIWSYPPSFLDDVWNLLENKDIEKNTFKSSSVMAWSPSIGQIDDEDDQ